MIPPPDEIVRKGAAAFAALIMEAGIRVGFSNGVPRTTETACLESYRTGLRMPADSLEFDRGPNSTGTRRRRISLLVPTIALSKKSSNGSNLPKQSLDTRTPQEAPHQRHPILHLFSNAIILPLCLSP
jgi:hypothetical protein